MEIKIRVSGMTIACNGDKWPNTNPNPLETFIGGKNGLPLPYATPTGLLFEEVFGCVYRHQCGEMQWRQRHNWVVFRLGEFLSN